METNRRLFFQGMLASAAIAPGVALGQIALAVAPPVEMVPAPPVLLEHPAVSAERLLAELTNAMAEALTGQLNRLLTDLPIDKQRVTACDGDTVCYLCYPETGQMPEQSRREATICCWQADREIDDSDRAQSMVVPSNESAFHFGAGMRNEMKPVLWRGDTGPAKLFTSRMPRRLAVQGCGAIDTIVETPHLFLRGLLYYAPTTMSQIVAFEVLCGVAFDRVKTRDRRGAQRAKFEMQPAVGYRSAESLAADLIDRNSIGTR